MMRHCARSVPADWRPTAKKPAGRASWSWLGGRAFGNESHRRLQTARVLFETDVLVVVNGDLVLSSKEARGGERPHRAPGTDDKTLAASRETAGGPPCSHA